MDTALLATTLLLRLLEQAQAVGALILKARSEGRDITTEELDALAAADDVVRDTLNAEIAKQAMPTGRQAP